MYENIRLRAQSKELGVHNQASKFRAQQQQRIVPSLAAVIACRHGSFWRRRMTSRALLDNRPLEHLVRCAGRDENRAERKQDQRFASEGHG
jgi:hypothetical protein